MERVRAQIGYQRAEMLGLSGKGIGIGVLDTGVNEHADLKNRIVAFKDFICQRESCYDDSGHGTHVCGIAAGDGRQSGGRLKGIAPGAHLVVGKILDHEGNGEIEDLILGIRWLLRMRVRYHLRIINISVGARFQEQDEKKEEKKKKLQEIATEAYRAGVLLVSAAGNFGPMPGSISAVGSMKYVVAVGCHDGAFVSRRGKMCAEYSARGPGYFGMKKPDIVAPGTEIISCAHEKRGYTKKSGTSMSAPMVSGALALAAERFQKESQTELVQRLLLGAKDLGEPFMQQGFGMLNLEGML